MPTVYDLKPAFQRLLRPMAGKLVGAGVSPNQLTAGALLLSLAVGGVILWRPEARWPLLILPAALFIRMALNALDGMMAREFGMASRSGLILNEVGDVLSDSALYLPLARVPGIDPILLVPVVVLAVISEMTGVIAVQVSGERRYDGPMGKSDRAFIFGALALGLGLGLPAGFWLDGVLALVLVLAVITIWNRARAALRGKQP